MSNGGAKGAGGLWPARATALALVAILTIPLLPMEAAPFASAQSTADPWWGPADRLDPTQGWAIRIPVIVENARLYPVKDAVVAVDVDFGALLVKAGWTNRTSGTETGLRGFTLDVDSIRVVEYGVGFAPGPIEGSRTQPLPHTFYTAPFHAERHKEFDAARNPAGTVLFLAKGDLASGARRFFYIYANPLEFGDVPPAQFRLDERAPLDAFLWGSYGTVTYGFEPQQDNQLHRVEVQAATNERTRVEVYTYNLGRFTLLPPTQVLENPFDLFASGSRSVPIPGNTAYKIVSDKPVRVIARGAVNAVQTGTTILHEAWGFLPATNGSYAGNEFWVYGYRRDPGQNIQQNPLAPTSVTVYKAAGAGTVTVTGGGGPPVTLTPTQPSARVNVAPNQWTRLASLDGRGNFLVSLGPPTAAPANPNAAPFPFHTVQVPARTGGPTGDDFYALVPNDGGFLRLCTELTTPVNVFALERPSYYLLPEGPADATPRYDLRPGCTLWNATPVTPASTLEALSFNVPGETRPREFSLLQGAGSRAATTSQVSYDRGVVGHFGGKGGVDIWTQGPIGVFGVYNDTRVQLVVEKERLGAVFYVNQSPFAVSADGFQVVDPAKYTDAAGTATGRLRLVASKPVSVVSVAPANHEYAHFVPGAPEQPRITVGAAEYRGPLVDLRSREKAGRQDFRSTGPGTPIAFPLEVVNLGRWIAGEGLQDTVSLRCTGPDGWTVSGCARDITLNSGLAERLDVTITPPADALNVNGTFTVEARSKFGGIVSTFKLIVFVEIRYGVGLWFDVEGGRKTIDPPIGVDPGAVHRYDVVVKNTGSARDTFTFAVDEARPGWTQSLTFDGDPVTSIALDGGESRTLAFTVTAPNTESAQQNLVSIQAQSTSSALAADIVHTATRIRPKININLELDPSTRVAEPNQTARFNLTVRNSGNDIFRIVFTREGLLPRGWNASLGLEEIDLGPGQPFTFPLLVTPPPDARAGDLATVKVTAETDAGTGGVRIPGDQVSAVVVVRKVHNITVPGLNDARVEPGATFSYVLPVTNAGNGNDVLELLPGAVDPDWSVATAVDGLALEPGASEDLPLVIGVPGGTAPGLYNLTFTLRLTREAFQNLTIPVEVLPTARVAFRGVDAVELTPGRAKRLEATAENVGNIPGTFGFAADAPEGWNVTFAPERARLAPGERAPVTVVVNASREATDGAYTLSLRALLGAEAAGATASAIDLARPALFIREISATGNVAPGELVLVGATVGNRGGTAAENVSVALLVDGEAVDRVVLSRIPVGDAKVATLSWLATKRTSDVRVVLDPEDEIVQVSRDQHEATVQFGSRLTPGAGVAFVVLAFAVAFALRRRSP